MDVLLYEIEIFYPLYKQSAKEYPYCKDQRDRLGSRYVMQVRCDDKASYCVLLKSTEKEPIGFVVRLGSHIYEAKIVWRC